LLQSSLENQNRRYQDIEVPWKIVLLEVSSLVMLGHCPWKSGDRYHWYHWSAFDLYHKEIQRTQASDSSDQSSWDIPLISFVSFDGSELSPLGHWCNSDALREGISVGTFVSKAVVNLVNETNRSLALNESVDLPVWQEEELLLLHHHQKLLLGTRDECQ
jgi:hypothetical protein